MDKNVVPFYVSFWAYVGGIAALFFLFDLVKKIKRYWEIKTSDEEDIGEGTIVIMCIAYELIFLFCLGSVSIYNFAKIFKAG